MSHPLGLSGCAWVAVGLAFLFGYSFTIVPVLRSGLALGAALSVALAADTISITVMEIVDNAIMLLIPGAMDAVWTADCSGAPWRSRWASRLRSPCRSNRALIRRGQGHAVVHEYHH